MLAKVGIAFQLRLPSNQPPSGLIALGPVLPENKTCNLTIFGDFPQPFLHRDPYISALATGSVAMNHFQQGVLLLTRRRDLPIQSLQGFVDCGPIRFEVYGFDLEVTGPFDGPLFLLPVSSPRHSFARFLIRRPPALGLALIPKLFAFCERKFNLYPTVLEIHPRRNERESLLLCLANQLADLLPVHQQLPGSQRSMIKNVPMLIGTNVGVQQPDLVVLHQPVRILQVSQSASDGLNLGPGQRYAGLKFFQQEIVM
jgi:hypothetical protein